MLPNLQKPLCRWRSVGVMGEVAVHLLTWVEGAGAMAEAALASAISILGVTAGAIGAVSITVVGLTGAASSTVGKAYH